MLPRTDRSFVFMGVDMKRLWDALTLAVCLLAAVCIATLTLTAPRQEISPDENRALSPLPSLSRSALISGDYFAGLSDFFSDNISFRKDFIRTRAVLQLLLGRQESGGVLFYKNGFLASRSLDGSEEVLLRNAAALKKLPEGSVCFLVPRSIDVYGISGGGERSEAAERIRRQAYSAFPDGVALYDELCALYGQGEQVYYATDHHLTTYGAYVAYVLLGKNLGYAPLAREYFDEVTVAENFCGTAYSSAGLLSLSEDTVELWRYPEDELIKIVREDGEELPLYDGERLAEKDKYRVFLGGNHALLRISRGDEKRPRLLLIKDSFANALIPFLAYHFDLTVIDPRYTDISVCELLDKESYDGILVLCGIGTLSTDLSFAKALYK